MKLLHVDSSIMGAASISRIVSARIVERFKSGSIPVEVTYRDLVQDPVPHVSAAAHRQRLARLDPASTTASDTDPDVLAIEAALVQFLEADVVVVGAPMHNLAITSQLKTWVDALSAPGRTFRYAADGVTGLCASKRMVIALSRGGLYAAGSPFAVLDHQEPYLRSFFGFLGVTDLTFVRAEGSNMGEAMRTQAIDEALAAAATLDVA